MGEFHRLLLGCRTPALAAPGDLFGWRCPGFAGNAVPVRSAPNFLFDNLHIQSAARCGGPSPDADQRHWSFMAGGVRNNGDEFTDIAVANKDGTVTVLYGMGNSQFSPPVHLQTGGGELRGIVFADFTGDGRRDVAVGAPYDGKVFLFVDQGSGSFTLTNFTAWRGARDLAAGDFDGDGWLDLAVAGTTNGVAQFRNTHDGHFEYQTNFNALGSSDDKDFPQPAFYLRSFRLPDAGRDELVAGRAQETKLYMLGANAERPSGAARDPHQY